MKGVLYVNSTLPAARELASNEALNPLHYWGYQPQPGDRVYAHRRDRIPIVMRARMRGLDLSILMRIIVDMIQGFRAVYLVTQPDLMLAIPLLRACFPTMRIITWAWTGEEVVRNRTSLSRCDHVLCLTKSALIELSKKPCPPASLQLWGGDPGFYKRSQVERIYDVAVIGLFNRDLALLRDATTSADHTFVVTSKVAQMAGIGDNHKTHITGELVNCLHQARATWILLRPDDNNPTGYTNLVDALMCGCSVVVADSSTIPDEVLSLPGVFKYKTGSKTSLLNETRRALEFCGMHGASDRIREAASSVLNGRKLETTIKNLLVPSK